MNHLLVVAALIARDDGRIMITQRSHGSHAGLWEFPGGKIESGEGPREALVRECREELGCTIRAGDIYEVIHHVTDQCAITLLFFLAEIVAGTPQPLDGVEEIAWATPEEMADYPLLDADRPLPRLFKAEFPHFRWRSADDSPQG